MPIRYDLFLVLMTVVCLTSVCSQDVLCTTKGNSGPLLSHIGYIELTFSVPYSNGTYTLYQTLASLTVKHSGVNNRPFPVVDIQYPTPTSIFMYLLETSDLEGTTGYEFNVSYAPLVNRTGHWLSFSGVSVRPFSCVTLDNSPPVAMFSLVRSNLIDIVYSIYFSEYVTGNFTETGLFVPTDVLTPANCTVYPRLTDNPLYSREYTTTLFSLTFFTDYGLLVLAHTVTDMAGNPNIQGKTCVTPDLYTSGPLTGTYTIPFSSVECINGSSSPSPSISIYDLNQDGSIDTIYGYAPFLCDETTFNGTSMRAYGAPIFGFSPRTSVDMPIAIVPDGYPRDNSITFNISVPTDFFRSSDSIVLWTPLSNGPFSLPYGSTVMYLNQNEDVMYYAAERNNLVVSPIIQSVKAINRTYICVVVSQNHKSNLNTSNFYFASLSGNVLVGESQSNQYSTCLHLEKQLERIHINSTNELLFLDTRPYGNPTNNYVGYPLTAQIPSWKGMAITSHIQDFVPITLLSAVLYGVSTHRVWPTLRLTFSEPVYIDNSTYNITILPMGLSSVIESITLSRDSIITINSTVLDLPVSVTCYNYSSSCYGTGTGTTGFYVERISGFEDIAFNALVSPPSGSIVPIDRMRPHVINVEVIEPNIVLLHFSEQIQFSLGPMASILYSSLNGRTLRSFPLPAITGNIVTMVFTTTASYDLITFSSCGMFVRDLSRNKLVCDPTLDLVAQFGNHPSMLSSGKFKQQQQQQPQLHTLSSTGGHGSVSTTHLHSSTPLSSKSIVTFSPSVVHAKIWGFEFPALLAFLFTAMTSVIIVSSVYLTKYNYIVNN